MIIILYAALALLGVALAIGAMSGAGAMNDDELPRRHDR
jgi:hypothetical protein